MEASPPQTIHVSGIECEPGLNGAYERNGFFKAGGGKPQWMKAGTRCYIRFTARGQWEIYVSHHPEGSTYFQHPDATASLPPLSGWQATPCAMPTDIPALVFEGTSQSAAYETAPAPSEDLILWSNDTCPFAQRVRIAILEQGLRVEERETDIHGERAEEQFRAAFAKACPDRRRRAAIPLLEHRTGDGEPIVLIESKVIVEYLDEAIASTCKLTPPDAVSRARSRLFVDAFDRAVGGCEAAILGAVDAGSLSQAADSLADGFRVLDSALEMYRKGDGPFLAGLQFGLAEVICAPQLQRLATLVPRFRPGMPGGAPLELAARFPRFSAWANAVLSRPSVISTYNMDSVARVKARAVATLKAEAMPQGPDNRRQVAKSALENMLKARQGRV